jgi:hypothetical protein
MSEYTTLIQTLALTTGVAWASGLNLYATVAALGLGGVLGFVELPPGLAIVQDPLVIVTASLMYCVEFVADKIPGVDTAWDALHSFIRIPSGALMAAGAFGETDIDAGVQLDSALIVAVGLLGGGVTAITHATKAGARVLINTSPEPFSNTAASLTEDAVVFAGLWAALFHPVGFLVGFGIFVLVAMLVFPRLWRGVRVIIHKLGRWLGMRQASVASTDDSTA